MPPCASTLVVISVSHCEMTPEVVEWLADVIVVLTIGPWAMRQALEEKLRIKAYIAWEKAMQRPELIIPNEWAEAVGQAIGLTPEGARVYAQDLWSQGWSVSKIQAAIRDRAARNGKQIFFTPPSSS